MKKLLFLSTLALLFSGPVASGQAAVYYQLGDTLKSAQLTSIDGNPLSLDVYSGKIIFINFFASW